MFQKNELLEITNMIISTSTYEELDTILKIIISRLDDEQLSIIVKEALKIKKKTRKLVNPKSNVREIKKNYDNSYFEELCDECLLDDDEY